MTSEPELRDLTVFLWILKLGAMANAAFFVVVLRLRESGAEPQVIIPALVLLGVSGYRCLFPNRYKDNIVLHRSLLSSTFVTRLLATFSEVAFVYLLSYVIRLLNTEGVGWIDALAWSMVVIVSVSQLLVWTAILTGRLSLYFYEEVGWALIFAANTLVSVKLFMAAGAPGELASLLVMNMAFGAVYLPWQFFHVRSLFIDAKQDDPGTEERRTPLAIGLKRSIFALNPRTDSESWGGFIGLTWMTAYWALLIPPWVVRIAILASAPG